MYPLHIRPIDMDSSSVGVEEDEDDATESVVFHQLCGLSAKQRRILQGDGLSRVPPSGMKFHTASIAALQN